MKLRSVIPVLLTVASMGCEVPQRPSVADILTNSGKGRYWDQVYSTQPNGTIHSSYSCAPLKQVRHVRYCTYFSGKSHAMHYFNKDSVRVINLNTYVGDVLYNPDTYKLTDSTLFFLGRTHRILTLTPQVLVLESVYPGGKSVQVYLPSKYQRKQRVK